MPDADCRTARRRGAGRDERIRPVIDVEQRALRALEQNRRTAALRAMNCEPDVIGEREQPRRETLQQRRSCRQPMRAL